MTESDLLRISGITTLIGVALCVLCIVCLFKLFKKAGEPGWAAIVPFYNYYVYFKIAFGNGWMFLLMFVPLVNFVIVFVMLWKFAKAYGAGAGLCLLTLFFPFISLPILAFNEDYQFVGSSSEA